MRFNSHLRLILSVVFLIAAHSVQAQEVGVGAAEWSDGRAREFVLEAMRSQQASDPAAHAATVNAVSGVRDGLTPSLDWGFRRMATSGRDETDQKVTYLGCAFGAAAYFVKGMIGVCIDSDKKVYKLFGLGAGLSAGMKAVFAAGFVRGNDAVIGDYDSLAVGPGQWGMTIAGIGVDGLVAKKSGNSGNVLFLAGVNVGVFLDASYVRVRLQ